MNNENNRSGGNMPKPPAANEVKIPDAPGDPDSDPSDKPPIVDTGAPPADSTVAAKERTSGIRVKAMRKGFIGGLRRNVGDKFLISGEKAWGSWMECEDKNLQERLVKREKERIKKIRQL